MAESRIEWTRYTWNCWVGCDKASPACASCYAEREMNRWGRAFNVVQRTSEQSWGDPARWNARLDPSSPMRDRLVFTCSFSDFFHEAADEWRDDAWDVIRSCRQLVFQILTKRPERIREHLPRDWGLGWSNVWLGVSVENPAFEWRIRELVEIPARLRFLSAEPLLREISLARWLGAGQPSLITDSPYSPQGGIGWVIVGGESVGRPGHPPRSMHPAWVQKIWDAAWASGVPFFFKQVGGRQRVDGHWGGNVFNGRTWAQIPEFDERGQLRLRVYR